MCEDLDKKKTFFKCVITHTNNLSMGGRAGRMQKKLKDKWEEWYVSETLRRLLWGTELQRSRWGEERRESEGFRVSCYCAWISLIHACWIIQLQKKEVGEFREERNYLKEGQDGGWRRGSERDESQKEENQKIWVRVGEREKDGETLKRNHFENLKPWEWKVTNCVLRKGTRNQ